MIQKTRSLSEARKESQFGSLELPMGLYRSMTRNIGKKPRGPSTGFREIFSIFLSGFCTSLSIYGTTANCGGYYHNRNVQMKSHHSCELESWALHYLMHSPLSKLCVWI
jgi:hypothetical protein